MVVNTNFGRFCAGFCHANEIITVQEERGELQRGANYFFVASIYIQEVFTLSKTVDRLANFILFAPVRLPVKIVCAVAPWVSIPFIFLCGTVKGDMYDLGRKICNGLLYFFKQPLNLLHLPTELPENISEATRKTLTYIAENLGEMAFTATCVGMVALRILGESVFFTGVLISIAYTLLDRAGYVPLEVSKWIEKYLPILEFIGAMYGGGGIVFKIMAAISVLAIDPWVRIQLFVFFESILCVGLSSAFSSLTDIEMWNALRGFFGRENEILNNFEQDIKPVLKAVAYLVRQQEWKEMHAPVQEGPITTEKAIQCLRENRAELYQRVTGFPGEDLCFIHTEYPFYQARLRQPEQKSLLNKLPKDTHFMSYLERFNGVEWKPEVLLGKLMDDERFIDGVVKKRFPNFKTKGGLYGAVREIVTNTRITLGSPGANRRSAMESCLKSINERLPPMAKNALLSKIDQDVRRRFPDLFNERKVSEELKNLLTVFENARILPRGVAIALGAVLTAASWVGELLGSYSPETILANQIIAWWEELIKGEPETLSRVLGYVPCDMLIEGLKVIEKEFGISGSTQEEKIQFLANSTGVSQEEYLAKETCEHMTAREVIVLLAQEKGLSADEFLVNWVKEQMGHFVHRLENSSEVGKLHKGRLEYVREIFAAVLAYLGQEGLSQVEKEDILLNCAVDGGGFCMVAYQHLAEMLITRVEEDYISRNSVPRTPLEEETLRIRALFEKNRLELFDTVWTFLNAFEVFRILINNNRHLAGFIKKGLYGALPLSVYEQRNFTLGEFVGWKLMTPLRYFFLQFYLRKDSMGLFEKAFLIPTQLNGRVLPFIYDKLPGSRENEEFGEALQGGNMDFPRMNDLFAYLAGLREFRPL